MIKQNKCISCGIEIDKRAKRCISCNRNWQVGKNNPNYRHGKACKNNKYYCINCNTEIIYYQSIHCSSCAQKLRFLNKEQRKICSNSRYGKDNPMFGVHRFGIINPNYIDGRSFIPYTLEFNSELKKLIRKRDNYICQNCGMTEEEHLLTFGQVLHIHHIDYNKKNCSKENLISLCNRCNVRANKNRSYWINFYKNIKYCDK